MSPILFLRCRHRLVYLSISLGKSSPGKFFTVSLKSVECLTAEREVAGSVLRVLKYIDTQMKCNFFFQEKFLFKNSESFSTFFLSITHTTSCYPPPLTSLYKPDLKYSQAGAIFPEVPVTFLAWKAVLCLPCLHSCKIKVSIILKIIQWNYQLTKQSWLVREQGSVLLLNKYWY